MTESKECPHKYTATTTGSPKRISQEVTSVRMRFTRSVSSWTWAKAGNIVCANMAVKKTEGVWTRATDIVYSPKVVDEYSFPRTKMSVRAKIRFKNESPKDAFEN